MVRQRRKQMSKKRKTSKLITDPAILAQAKAENAQRKAAYAAKKKSIRQSGWKQAGQGMKELMWSNNVDTLDGAASGALKALGFGDKKTVIKGALEGIADSHPIKKNLNAVGKLVSGAAKGLFNDLSWYNNYPESTVEMIGPNFNVRKGVFESLLDLNSAAAHKPSVPSFCSINLVLTRGSDATNAVQSALTKIYTTIRRANAGSVNWKTYQLDAYIYNWRVIIALYSVCIRGLKYLNKYSVVDNNIPYTLFASLGLDYDDFKTNAAEIRNYLLAFRTRMMGYAIPAFDILKRTYWLFSNGFTDSDDIKAQTYHFVPRLEKYWKEGERETFPFTNAFAPAVGVTTGGMKWAQIKTEFDELMAEFFSHEFYNIIAGDIVKAYGVQPLFILDKLPALDEMPTVGYNEEVLCQIQNIYLPRTGAGSHLLHYLTYDAVSETIKENVTYTETGYANIPSDCKTQTFLNLYKNNISNLDVIGASRFISFATNSNSTFTLKAYGSEVVDTFKYYILDSGTGVSNPHDINEIQVTNLQTYDVTSAANIESFGLAEMCWSIFDWSPRIIQLFTFYTSGSTSSTTAIGATLFDLNNYAKITSIDELDNIHSIALQSLYYTPMMAKLSTNVVELPEHL